MTETEWFRNASWDVAIEKVFEEKIRRARSKDQYLRIQASMLVATHPEVALRLLAQYFDLPKPFGKSQAHVDRANALTTLGRHDHAIESYEAALVEEERVPSILTDAYIALPYLIARYGLRNHYVRARELLRTHESRLTFPVDHFRWHAALSIIAFDLRDSVLAQCHATKALDAAALEKSGFRSHSTLGLVTNQYDDILKRLMVYRGA